MKRVIVGLMLSAVVVLGLYSPHVSAAELEANVYDDYFLQTMDELMEEAGYGLATVQASKEIIYDIELQPLGYVYLFTVDGEAGYALMTVRIPNVPMINEFYFDAACPFEGLAGKWVYVNQFLYWYNVEGTYYDAQTNAQISDEEYQSAKELSFTGGLIVDGQVDYITYVSKTENKTKTDVLWHPAYSQDSLAGGCAAVSGGNIVGFFDRYYPELIPNFTPGTMLGQYYSYLSDAQEVHPIIEQLYADMGIDEEGATVSMFMSGLQKYCQRKNRTATFFESMLNGKLNWQAVKNQLDSGYPVAMFLQTLAMNSISDLDHQDKLVYKVSLNNHVVTAFGYREITYTFADNSQRTDRYVAIAAGSDSMSMGYLNVDLNAPTIADAVAVRIG